MALDSLSIIIQNNGAEIRRRGNHALRVLAKRGRIAVNTSETAVRESIPVAEYVKGSFVPLSHLPHGWELHSAIPLSPAEERGMVREPAQAIPASIVERLGKVRVLVVPFVACTDNGDAISFSKPKGETHSAVWVESGERIDLVLPCRELDPHDTGFEFLASVAELLRPKLTSAELERYTQLLEAELRSGVPGEIDEEATAAKRTIEANRFRRRLIHEPFERYRDVSFVSTVAEYMHGLWHDVQIRVGPDHLPVPQLRSRMVLMSEMFPPNAGYQVFSEELRKEE